MFSIKLANTIENIEQIIKKNGLRDIDYFLRTFCVANFQQQINSKLNNFTIK